MLVKPWQHIKIYLQLASSTGKLINLHNNKECIKKQNKIANKYYTFLAQTCQYKVVMQILMSEFSDLSKLFPQCGSEDWTHIFQIPPLPNTGHLYSRFLQFRCPEWHNTRQFKYQTEVYDQTTVIIPILVTCIPKFSGYWTF